MDYVDIGRRIRIQRRQLNLTQGELAKLIGVSSSFIGHLERGTRQASLETLVALANVLDVSVDYLLAASLKRTDLANLEKPFSERQLDTMQEMLALLDAYVRTQR
ncbi:MAG: helix-turn-helix domain-containing protein [Clostridia bacterium]|nr:helix-turn-helix domain-containing protein [Clostridia bacterium]